MKKIDSENKNRPEGKNMILAYGFKENEIKKIKEMKDYSKIDEINIIPKESDNMKIRDLINHKYMKIEKRKNVDILDMNIVEMLKTNNKNKVKIPKLVLFNAVSNYELDRAVNYIKKEFEEIPLIAMVTKVSINWELSELLVELRNERAEFSKK